MLKILLRPPAFLLILLVMGVILAAPAPSVAAQGRPTPTPAAPGGEEPIEAPDRVEVEPAARDEEIGARLQSILEATGWFTDPDVRVEEGVVFLEGETQSEEFKEWAANLARRTQDVVAVVNRIEVEQPPIWDFQPALAGLREQARRFVRTLPLLLFSLLVLVAAAGVARLTANLAREALGRRDLNRLLVTVIARGVSLVVFLLGLYLVFQIAGLTSVALTLVGGTGLLGLILGIAFQDITENFLASILLSVQSPFRSGDLVEIEGVVGYV
ncbi:MAG: mechanosensitive ion channel, partial [Candidatus Promineifilaceae bacterium]|nr:mechanosensitive ion channel [Candidatus Promineifilaceae bacterium]